MTAPAAVDLEGVGKRFGEGTGAVQAVTDIDLTVAAGEFVSLIGPSGCGKSTLLRIVAEPHRAERGHGDWSTASRRGRRGWTRTTASPSSRPGCSSGGRCRATWSCRSGCTAVARRSGAARRSSCSSSSDWPTSPSTARASSRAACSSASRSPARSRAAGAAADGRALRRARRDDARAHAVRADPDLRGDGRGGRLRHALDPRGRVPLRPRGGDVAAPGAHHRDRRRPARRPRRGRPRGRAVLRRDHRGPRGAARALRRSPTRAAA